ncbi:MAG: hypothetical protein HY908_26305 [Myxococcales bacterium]|nr:hypothetical protein [Myxococcales bacterium]
MKLALALCLGAALGALVPGEAAAQPTPPPSAEAQASSDALFEEAGKLMKAGDDAKACPLLEEAARLAPGIGILFRLAECYEHTGRTASAWTRYGEVVTQARAAKNDRQETTARDRVAALTPRLTRLRIEVPADVRVAGLEVLRDGEVVGSGAWAVDLPVNPGEHVVAARAPGHADFETKVETEGEGKVARVVIPKLPPGSGTSKPPAPDHGTRPAPVPAPVPDPEPADGGGAGAGLPLGITAVVLGAAGMGAGVGLGLLARGNARSAACDADDVCTSEGLDTRARAVALGNGATGIFFVGAAFALIGVVVAATSPASEATEGDATDTGVTFDTRGHGLRF